MATRQARAAGPTGALRGVLSGTGGAMTAVPAAEPRSTEEESGRGGRARRLHPLTFVVGAVREMLALLAAGAAGLAVGGLSTAFFFTLVGLGLGFAFHVVTWATFTYTVHEDRIELRRALVGRSVKTIPRERIRGVDVSTSLPHRLLGLAVVHIDAGSEGGEGALNAVSRQEAERLRGLLLRRTPDTAAGPGGTVLAGSRPRWYVYAPLSGAYLLTPFALAGSLLGTLYNLGDDFGLITEQRVTNVGEGVLGLPVYLGIALAVVFLVAMPVASVVVFALFNWGFTLRDTGEGTLVAERGLITRRSVSLERRRIRGVMLEDNPFERLAGVVRLGALVTGLGDAAQRGRLLPTAPRAEAVTLVARILGDVPPELVRHPRAARGRRVARAMSPPLGLAGIALLAAQPWAAYVFAAVAVAAIPLGLDRYRQLGHGTDGARLTVRSGSLRRRQAVVEHRAVVGWRLRQTLFQRRLGLATLVAGVGAGEGGYPAVDLAHSDAVHLAHEITPEWVRPFLERP